MRMHTENIAVQFSHGAEFVPGTVNGKPTRFASIDSDGALIAWATDAAPVLDDALGVWVADTANDLLNIATVGDGDYSAYIHAVRAINSH